MSELCKIEHISNESITYYTNLQKQIIERACREMGIPKDRLDSIKNKSTSTSLFALEILYDKYGHNTL